jgi:hypothetical protein
MRAHRPTTVQGAAAVAVGIAALAASCGAATPALAAAPTINWDPITHCESGGNPTAHNATSSASGLYQFLTSTWLRYGGAEFAPTAAQATPAQQTIVANRAYAANGLNDWVYSRGCWGDQLGSILGGHTTVPAPAPAPKPAPKAAPKPAVASVSADMVLTAPQSAPAPAPAAVPAPAAPAAPATGQTYTVRPGDTLWGIAPAHAWHALYERNQAVVGQDPDLIYPGQQLKL